METASQEDDPANNHIRNRGKTTTLASVASTATAATSRLRSTSLKLLNADAPLGMWAASSHVAAKAPTIVDIREGQFVEDGWLHEAQKHYREQRRSTISGPVDGEGEQEGKEQSGRGRKWSIIRRSSTGLGGNGLGAGPTSPVPIAEGKGRKTVTAGDEKFPPLDEENTLETAPSRDVVEVLPANEPPAKPEKDIVFASEKGKTPSYTELPAYLRPLPSGYLPPPKLPWTTSTGIALKAFWKWFLTPMGFLITLYGLNVVAWGGMLFLLLCNAAPAMCHPTCNDINSPRRKWIEVDSQILNGLFCVTGFGLAPWRFRDLWWLLVYRIGLHGRSSQQKMVGLRRLAGIHRGWFRLPGSDHLGPHVFIPTEKHAVLDDQRTPVPASKTPEDPLTGIRAPPTKIWKLDFVIWCNVWNTFLQACLCGFMWGMNRYNRPSWATGLFIGLACVVAGVGGAMIFNEGKKVKRVEGVPVKVVENLQDIEERAGKHGTLEEEDHAVGTR